MSPRMSEPTGASTYLQVPFCHVQMRTPLKPYDLCLKTLDWNPGSGPVQTCGGRERKAWDLEVWASSRHSWSLGWAGTSPKGRGKNSRRRNSKGNSQKESRGVTMALVIFPQGHQHSLKVISHRIALRAFLGLFSMQRVTKLWSENEKAFVLAL